MNLNKVIIAPDSFKGSLTAQAAAKVIAGEVHRTFPNCEIISIPIADGGEGSLDTIMSAVSGKIFSERVISPDGSRICADYGITTDKTAIIELAQSSGITRQRGLNPLTSSTYGYGELIASALARGARSFVLCLGGSATTDGGCGMAAALGAVFLNSKKEAFVPCGGMLKDIETICLDLLDRRIAESSFTAMCDVDNPLYGTNGAAYIYGPQKGAVGEQLDLLDSGLVHLAGKLAELGFSDCGVTPGAGAAGGLGAGCCCFLGATLKSGIEAILELCGFSDAIKNADLVITGEGRLDSQSFSGKALSGILNAAGTVPVLSICGDIGSDAREYRRDGFAAFCARDFAPDTQACLAQPEYYLALAVRNALNQST